MKKIGIIFTLLMLFTATLIAQDHGVDIDKLVSKIYLKNGSIFTGKVISYQRGGEVVIEISGQQLTFQADEVKKIVQVIPGETQQKQKNVEKKRSTKKKMTYKERKKKKRKEVKRRKLIESGWYHHYDVMVGGTKDGVSREVAGVGVSAAGGYQFNRYFGVGFGAGFDRYSRKRKEKIIPVFAEIKSYPFGKEKFLELSLIGGYGFALAIYDKIEEAKGGWMYYPSIGMRVASSDGKSDLLLSVGYKFQKASFTYIEKIGSDVEVFHQFYRRFTIRLSMMFWK